ncbi:hypothetical protein [Pseudoneobacillus sp. C159]
MMKKWLLVMSVMGSLFIASACSDQTAVNENEPDTEQVDEDSIAVVDDSSEEIDGVVEQGDGQLTEKEEYNQIFSIFLDDEMRKSFEKLVGDDLNIFRVTFQQINPVPTEDENQMAFHGYIPGLEGVAEGVVIFDTTGKIWAATSEGEKVNFYNNAGEKNQHHPIIEEWRQSFFSGSEIVYKAQ